jgi:hypothetical protein
MKTKRPLSFLLGASLVCVVVALAFIFLLRTAETNPLEQVSKNTAQPNTNLSKVTTPEVVEPKQQELTSGSEKLSDQRSDIQFIQRRLEEIDRNAGG